MNKILPILSILLLLTGCNRDGESEAPAQTEANDAAASEPATTMTDPVELARNDPETLRQSMSDPAQREALIQSMRERRGRLDEDGRMASREELRERMRERRAELATGEDGEDRRANLRERQLAGATAWWEDPAISEQLDLSPAQRERIESANREREASLETGRTALAQAQRDLMQALRSGERGQIEPLLVDRHEAASALSEAELAWQRQLLDTLTDQQLVELATHNPQLLIGRQRPM